MYRLRQIQIVAMFLLLGSSSSAFAQTINGKIYGGGELATVDGNTNIKVNTGTVGKPADDPEEYNGGVFGGGLGQVTVVTGNVEVLIGRTGSEIDAEGPTINGDVYGGSALGNTNCSMTKVASDGKTTTVRLNAGVINGSMYGGALGQKTGSGGAIAANVYGPVQVEVNGGLVLRRSNDVGGTTSGGIYGCNNLNGSPQTTVGVDIWRHNTATYSEGFSLFAVYGGGNQADYSGGTPNVTIHNCSNNIEYVYGGGNAAHLTHATNGNTNVIIWGGNTIGNVFGGGNGQVQAANVAGNTNVTIHGGKIGNVFGGSNTDGNIGGSTSVSVEAEVEGGSDPCVMDIVNVYGGGNVAAGKSGTVTIACTGDGVIENVYGGANNANLTGDITLNITGGKIGNVFGGNNNGGTIDGNITVNVDWTGSCGANALNNVYGGGNKAAYTSNANYPEVNIYNATITGNVFGGGLGETAKVTGNPRVNVITNCPDNEHSYNHNVTIKGSVYGGGSAAPVEGNPIVTTQGDTDKKVLIENHVFGGGLGNTAKVDGSTRVNIYGNTEIQQNVYGGGNGGVVTGDTYVEIGESETPAP